MTDSIEREANEFAMHLLAPTSLLKRDLKALGPVDIEADETIYKLAKRYKVSAQIMAIRIGQVLAKG